MVDSSQIPDRHVPAFDDALLTCDAWKTPREPGRHDAHAALASALVDAGLQGPVERALAGGHPIDLALLEAITERPGLPGSIGRLIREYLGSLTQITSGLVPASVLVNGTTEISTWRYDFGRLAGAEAGRSGPIQPA